MLKNKSIREDNVVAGGREIEENTIVKGHFLRNKN